MAQLATFNLASERVPTEEDLRLQVVQETKLQDKQANKRFMTTISKTREKLTMDLFLLTLTMAQTTQAKFHPRPVD